MRLIDADDLIFNFCDHPQYSASMFSKIKQKIQEAPTIDAHPIIHGKWKKRKNWCEYVCSCCSFESDMTSNFCQNCGAKMDV